MITIICGTNRKNSRTSIFAYTYYNILKNKGIESRILSMEDYPADLSVHDIYKYNHPEINNIVEKYIKPAEKLVFIVPEYNGGVPGILKLFIDSVDPKVFTGKKAGLVGVATGRSGNLRGLDHLAAMLNYLQTEVMAFKLPVSRIDTLMEDGKIHDEATLKSMELHAERLLGF
jgi:NAD(P)H-dependent FMN reductase